MGQGFIYYEGKKLAAGMVPVSILEETTQFENFLREFAENDIRTALTPQDRVRAVAKIQKVEAQRLADKVNAARKGTEQPEVNASMASFQPAAIKKTLAKFQKEASHANLKMVAQSSKAADLLGI